VDIVVATPGRLIDLGQQGHIDMSRVEIFVLDEADRMLHMGFAPDVKRIMARLPEKRQSLLFSATMPREIVEIANRLLQDPVKIEVASDAPTADRITQHVCHVDRSNKLSLLTHMVSGHPDGLVLVFSRTKHGSNKLAKQLTAAGIQADAIHGNKSQRAREKALEQFRAGKVRVLVATDIAARGIDVKGISLVINHDIPHEPESYVHRIGRTARAGAEGKAIAFCDTEERGDLNAIEKLIGIRIPVIEDHPYAIPTPDLRRSVGQVKGRAGGNGGQRRGQRRRGSFVRSDGSGDEGRGRQKEWNPDIVQKKGSRTFRV
jgi:ATP-dependent RNA helicase RhlE